MTSPDWPSNGTSPPANAATHSRRLSSSARSVIFMTHPYDFAFFLTSTHCMSFRGLSLHILVMYLAMVNQLENDDHLSQNIVIGNVNARKSIVHNFQQVIPHRTSSNNHTMRQRPHLPPYPQQQLHSHRGCDSSVDRSP